MLEFDESPWGEFSQAIACQGSFLTMPVTAAEASEAERTQWLQEQQQHHP
jgi:hypothetical protein